jgi:Tfp pilus assembly protein PilN
MIEINLVPDVKQELLNAQRVRTSVISLSIIVGLATVGIVVVLAIWVFVVQAARGALADGAIKEESAKLAEIEDISNTLTIQNQLSKLSSMHDSKNIDSRVFDILTTINPAAPNNVSITNLSLDSATKTIRIEAQASGYPALEVFKKTIEATKFQFTKDGQKQTVPLASQIDDSSDRSYGEDASGAQVLRFSLSFMYPDELFSRQSADAVIVAPTRSNVTDSFLGVPTSLFSAKATDKEGN